MPALPGTQRRGFGETQGHRIQAGLEGYTKSLGRVAEGPGLGRFQKSSWKEAGGRVNWGGTESSLNTGTLLLPSLVPQSLGGIGAHRTATAPGR